VDAAGSQGFPGAVTSFVTYSLGNQRLYTTINGTATENTPLMLSQNIHWNLDGFGNPASNTATQHSLLLPFSGQRIEVDDKLIPTGAIISNTPGSTNDFWSDWKPVAPAYDSALLISRTQYAPATYFQHEDGRQWWEVNAVASLRSEFTGIQVDLFTDQDAIQVSACNKQ
jgi:aldose 1-epimerase